MIVEGFDLAKPGSERTAVIVRNRRGELIDYIDWCRCVTGKVDLALLKQKIAAAIAEDVIYNLIPQLQKIFRPKQFYPKRRTRSMKGK